MRGRWILPSVCFFGAGVGANWGIMHLVFHSSTHISAHWNTHLDGTSMVEPSILFLSSLNANLLCNQMRHLSRLSVPCFFFVFGGCIRFDSERQIGVLNIPFTQDIHTAPASSQEIHCKARNMPRYIINVCQKQVGLPGDPVKAPRCYHPKPT